MVVICYKDFDTHIIIKYNENDRRNVIIKSYIYIGGEIIK